MGSSVKHFGDLNCNSGYPGVFRRPPGEILMCCSHYLVPRATGIKKKKKGGGEFIYFPLKLHGRFCASVACVCAC